MAKNEAEPPPLPPRTHRAPTLPHRRAATLFPHLFHADHFANADVQPGRDDVLRLRVLGAFLCRLWGAKGTVGKAVCNPRQHKVTPDTGPNTPRIPCWATQLCLALLCFASLSNNSRDAGWHLWGRQTAPALPIPPPDALQGCPCRDSPFPSPICPRAPFPPAPSASLLALEGLG